MCFDFKFGIVICTFMIVIAVHDYFRHDAGLRWVLFFQDTNGLLFKVGCFNFRSLIQICLIIYSLIIRPKHWSLFTCLCRQFQLLWVWVLPDNTMLTLLLFHAKQKKLLEELPNLLMLMVFCYFIERMFPLFLVHYCQLASLLSLPGCYLHGS